MWKRSKPGDYNSFRTFIFGITKQSMFPHGVVYEGVSDEAMSFRGESGANDSMVRLVEAGARELMKLIQNRSRCATICLRSPCPKHHLLKF